MLEFVTEEVSIFGFSSSDPYKIPDLASSLYCSANWGHFFRCALAQVLVLVNTDLSSANSLPSLLIHALHTNTAALLDLFTLIDRTSTYGVSQWGQFSTSMLFHFASKKREMR